MLILIIFVQFQIQIRYNLKMSAENEVQACSNCNKEFPFDKIDLHEAYCCRNIRRCQQCEAMIDIKDMDDHISEQHSKKPCNMCNLQFLPDQMSKHEQQCNRRPMLCQFCQNKYAFQEFKRHQEMCGARTRPCPQCNRLICLNDIAAHQSRCNRRNQQRRQEREISQDPYVPRHRQQAQRVERDRQNSTNNLRNPADRSSSTQNNNMVKPQKIKQTNVVGPELIKPSLDPIPISVRLAMKQKQVRVPLKNKN